MPCRLVSRRLMSKLQATDANLQWENLRFHFPSLARNKKSEEQKKSSGEVGSAKTARLSEIGYTLHEAFPDWGWMGWRDLPVYCVCSTHTHTVLL